MSFCTASLNKRACNQAPPVRRLRCLARKTMLSSAAPVVAPMPRLWGRASTPTPESRENACVPIASCVARIRRTTRASIPWFAASWEYARSSPCLCTMSTPRSASWRSSRTTLTLLPTSTSRPCRTWPTSLAPPPLSSPTSAYLSPSLRWRLRHDLFTSLRRDPQLPQPKKTKISCSSKRGSIPAGSPPSRPGCIGPSRPAWFPSFFWPCRPCRSLSGCGNTRTASSRRVSQLSRLTKRWRPASLFPWNLPPL